MQTQRDAFFDKLYEIAVLNRDIVLVVADMGAPALDKWRLNIPGQFINAGIAEQNAVAVAAGLAHAGKKVFVYAIASFISVRCYEQIKIDLCAMNLPVTLVGIGAGLSYSYDGPTHHAVEDIAALRCLPNLEINNITDHVMAAAFAEISCGLDHPNYVRLDKQKFLPVYPQERVFDTGLAVLAPNTDKCIIATGNMVHRALTVAQDINVGVIDVFTFPINEGALYDCVKDCTQLYTLEEHVLPGGLGSAVCEFVADWGMGIPIMRFGLDMCASYCHKYGKREYLQSLYGLSEAWIKEVLLRWI